MSELVRNPDLIPDAAVEAAARALFCRDHPEDGDLMWPGELSEDTRAVYREDALTALTVSAPHITAQATADDPRKVAHIECDCVPDLGPSHCHLCSERAGREMPWTEAHPDLRARIEALRDEWRAEADHSGKALHNEHADYDVGYLRARQAVYASHADALDALLAAGAYVVEVPRS